MKRWSLISLVLALALCAAVGVALASSGKAPARAYAKAPAKAHVAKALPRSAARAQGANPGENTPSDPDNVQQGDQNAPDTTSPSEAAGSELTPGDASVDGVEQPAGADHQCPPDCSPGEQ
jgi:hypothetical protein